MTSPSTAYDRYGYSRGLPVGLPSSAARSGLPAPAIGDAFADVFRMIASVDSPAAPQAPPEATSPQSDQPNATDSPESEDVRDEAETESSQASATAAAAAATPNELPSETEADANQPTDTAAPTEDSAHEPEVAVEPTAETAADTEAVVDEAAAAAALKDAALVEAEQINADGSGDQPAVAETDTAVAATLAVETANPSTDNSITNSDATTSTVDPDSSATLTSGQTVTAATASDTDARDGDGDGQKPVLANYTGETEDATGGQNSDSRRRLRGQERDSRGQGEPVQAEHPGGDAMARELPAAARGSAAATSAAATQDAGATGIDVSGLTPQPAGLADPAAAAIVPPTAASTAAAAAVTASSKNTAPAASGETSPSAPRTVTDPAAGSDTSSPREVRSSAAGKEANEGPRVADRALLVQRVSRAFQRLSFDGGQVRIRLHPEELGGVQLQLSVQGQRMSGRVVAETEAARSILTQHLPELRQRLADQGMQVERLDVQLEGEQDAGGETDLLNRDSAGQGRAGQGREGQDDGARYRAARQLTASSAAPPAPSTTASQANAGSPRSVVQAAQQKSVDLLG